jgi:hypothetical protein
VNLVMASPRGPAVAVTVLQDGKPLSREQATKDISFRQADGREESYVMVQHPRMYALVDNHDFGDHLLELRCAAGFAAFAFTFTSCVDPVRSALGASVVQS